MDHITLVDDALAWCRFGTVFRQCEVFRRGAKHYIKNGPSYIRICDKLGSEWITTDSKVKVLEIEGIEL